MRYFILFFFFEYTLQKIKIKCFSKKFNKKLIKIGEMDYRVHICRFMNELIHDNE